MIVEQNQLWTAVDVAHFLQVSRSWVYQKAESGLLPCLRIGGLLRFDPDAIRAYASGERSFKRPLLTEGKR
jgi:excisionase family DNA binding protein